MQFTVEERRKFRFGVATAHRMAELFDLPRAGGKPHRSRGWSRLLRFRGKKGIHRLLHKEEFVRRLMLSQPTALAFLELDADEESWEYRYNHKIRFICIDVDLKVNDVPYNMLDTVKSQIFEAMEHIYHKMDAMGLAPALTHSGSKGYHILTFIDEPIDLGYSLGVYNSVMEGTPHFRPHGAKWILTSEDGTLWAEIDSLYKRGGDGALLKVPFSQHQNVKGFYEMPIDITDLRNFTPIHDPGRSDFAKAELIAETWHTIPSTLITDNFPKKNEVGRRGRPKGKHRVWTRTDDLRIPEDHEYPKEIAEIDEWWDTKSAKFLPCFWNAVSVSIPKRDAYDMRTVIARIISNRMRKHWDHDIMTSKEIVALWVKLRLNDLEDNANPDRMKYHVNYWIDNHSNIVNYCSALQEEGAPFHCCDQPCGRSTPLEIYRTTDEYKLNIPPVSELTFGEILDEARAAGANLQIFKGTRVGGTTTVIANALEHNERITVIVPTTKIAETIEEAMEIANNGSEKTAVLMARNTEMCLKIKMRVEQNRDDFPDQPIALLDLPAVTKPSCAVCPYVNNLIDIERGRVERESDLSTNSCLFQTNMAMIRSNELDIMVITHKKLYNTVMAYKAAEQNELITGTTDAQDIIDWISFCDEILVDEISLMIDQPDMALPLYSVPSDGGDGRFDLIDKINDEMALLGQFRLDFVNEEMQAMVDNLIGEFREFQSGGDYSEPYERDINAEEEELIHKMLKRIQTVATRHNYALTYLYSSLLILREGRWIVIEEPDMTLEDNIKIYTMPKFQYAVSEVLAGSSARLVAMDATWALSGARHLDRILGVPFQRKNIGDPNDASKFQKLIPWPTTISMVRLMKEDDTQAWIEIQRALNLVDKLFDLENVIIAVPNKKIEKRIRRLYRGKKLDVLWHRGSGTVGVRNEKRIMVGVCAPYAPKKSHNWVKDYVHPEVLSDISHESLWRYDRHKTEYQTLSRVKSPNFNGENVRSVYIAIGQPISELEQMRSCQIEPPEIIPVVNSRLVSDRYMIPVLTGWAWKEHGLVLDKSEQLALRLIWRGESDAAKIQRSIAPHQISRARVEELSRLSR